MRIGILFLLTLMFVSCGGVKTTGDSGKPSLVKIFNRPDGSKMYFAGPVFMNEVEGKGSVEMDFTVVDQSESAEANNMVRVNFTYSDKANEAFKLNEITFQCNTDNAEIVNDYEVLFKEKQGKYYRYRYSSFLSRDGFIKWVNGPATLKLDSMSFEAGKKYDQHMQMIKDQILFAIQ
ncbi:MAG: hypothetical protein MK081_14360 [Flavobacteriales bacterium]|nr:hypothetical protein [Flavobacteriales bacterium]